MDIQWITYEIEAREHDHLNERARAIAKKKGIEFKGFLGRPHDEPREDFPVMRLTELPLKPEQKKPDEYQIEEWNLLWAHHLQGAPFAWHYKIEGSWNAKNFAFLQEAREFLKKGSAITYIHVIRRDGPATWKPADIPDITLKPRDKKSVGLDIYTLEQPIFTDRRQEWVWRISFWDGVKHEGKDIEMTEKEFKDLVEKLPDVRVVRVVDWVNIKQWGNAPTILLTLSRLTPIFTELELQCIRMEGGDRDWVCREDFLALLKLKAKELDFEIKLAGKFEKKEEQKEEAQTERKIPSEEERKEQERKARERQLERIEGSYASAIQTTMRILENPSDWEYYGRMGPLALTGFKDKAGEYVAFQIIHGMRGIFPGRKVIRTWNREVLPDGRYVWVLQKEAREAKETEFPLKPEEVKKKKVLTLEGIETTEREVKKKRVEEPIITPEQLLKGAVLDSSIEAGRVRGLTEFAPKKWVVEWLTTKGWQVHGRYNSKENAEKIVKLLDEAHDIEARVREE